MASLASLLGPSISIPQPDFGWIGGAVDSIGGAIQRGKENKSFNKLADLIGNQPAGTVQQRQSGGAQAYTAPVTPVERGAMQGDTYKPFMDTIRAGGVTNPYALAAIAATGKAESGWSADKARSTWSDPSESGQAGTSGGVMSWRGPRYQAMAAGGDLSPEAQARFFLQEDPQLIAALNNARSPEEAAGLMANAWKFAGYDRAGGEAARRQALARNYYAQEYSQMPNDAASAIEAVAPAGGFDDGRFADVIMPAQGRDQLSAALQQTNADGVQTGSVEGGAPVQVADASGGMPASTMLAQGTPVQRGRVDPSLIQFMLRDPNLRDYGMKLWQQNVTGGTGEPWQFVTLPDGTLARANQQTGSVERLGNFGKPEEAPNSYQEFQYAQRDGFKGTYADWQKVKSPGTSVTVNSGEGDKFYENLDKKNAETFSAMSEAGIQARGKLAQVDRLTTLLSQSPQGAEAGIKLWLGDMGVNTEGLNSIQATRALLEKMVPDQRPPGSGPMSDADIVMFRNSLPRLINQQGGNELILQTMRGIANYEMEMGRIADMVADRSITPAEGRKQIRELENPLARYREAAKADGEKRARSSNVARPTSQEEYDELPSGALFTDPDDGKTYRKP